GRAVGARLVRGLARGPARGDGGRALGLARGAHAPAPQSLVFRLGSHVNDSALVPRSGADAARAAGIAGPRGTRPLAPLRLGSNWARPVRYPRVGTGPRDPCRACPSAPPSGAGGSLKHDFEDGTLAQLSPSPRRRR